MKTLKRFLARDDGAVTVDWVVLAAAAIVLAALISSAMQDGALGLADGLASYMSDWTF
ncbi:hypothetical protein [Tritonibacter horizontis]|uniref:Uncharacterized protein n=1 Tax=Tritonibacter horizontis TaxID=1768241 RepID=A0A132BVF9_9RHOB|nr:hypothetical protein [Tritonibacter horizontis]KUP92353.1 hypothetical protein TRIHO_26570 [Tritonibacter horizontis]